MTAVLDPKLVEATPNDTDDAHVHMYDIEGDYIPAGSVAACGYVAKIGGEALQGDVQPADLCNACEEIVALEDLFDASGGPA